MDVVINSNIQSPLVRTLARTKGKSESFTNKLKDNVPPVSFSKIELAPDGGSVASYNQTYKFRLPQYGYLRNFILKFSATELPISATLMSTINTQYLTLPDSYKSLVGVERTPAGAAAPRTQAWMWHGLVPPGEGKYQRTDEFDPWASMWYRIVGGENIGTFDGTGAGDTIPAVGGARITPFRYRGRDSTSHANSVLYTPYEVENLAREGPIYDIVAGVLQSAAVEDSGLQYHKVFAGDTRQAGTWDWCSQANLSKHLGALFPESVTLTTHNRPIQTIYPLETLARIYRMPLDMKKRYLAMIRPHITASPGTGSQETAFTTNVRSEESLYGTNRSWSCYFPCLFSFFEDTSMNLDTRFVENLEVDVKIRPRADIYWSGDISAVAAPNMTTGRETLNANAAGNIRSMFESANWRQTEEVIGTTFTLEALAYYHNFHDTTSQAIRDANYKPNIPANLLTYNTYAENPVQLAAAVFRGGGTVNISLSCNNLVFGITFMVRRRIKSAQPLQQAFVDHTQTLPIKSVTLSGSGQQLYKASGQEALLVDSWDHPLSSMKNGQGLTNTTGLYADNHASYYAQSKEFSETFFAYYIPFGFSQDMTYNSGALALQTINNPTLTIEMHELDGWVLNDENMGQYLQPMTNNTSGNVANALDNDFEVVVYENFWQMTRIDSNTGSITKSLDL